MAFRFDFAGIVTALPKTIQNLAINYNPSDLYTYVLFAVIAVVTVIGVVIISEGQRNVPVSYAKQIRGNKHMAEPALTCRSA